MLSFISHPKRISQSVLAILLLSITASVLAQETPDMAKGLSVYAEYVPDKIDNYNPVNGNIFLKIPLLSYPQKGGKLHLNFNIYYTDKQWYLLHSINTPMMGPDINDGQWQISQSSVAFGGSNSASGTSAPGVFANTGAYIAADQDLYFTADSQVWLANFANLGIEDEQILIDTDLQSFAVFTPDGSKHYVGEFFDQTCTHSGVGICQNFAVPAQNFYPATDATGYTPIGIVYDGYTSILDANGIKYTVGSGGTGLVISDPNGNTINETTTGGWNDTFGRNIPGSQTGIGTMILPNNNPYPATPTEGLTPGVDAGGIASECPVTGTGTLVGSRSWTVPVSESYDSGNATYYLCYSKYSYQTNFNASAIFSPMVVNVGGSGVNVQCDVHEASSSTSNGTGDAVLLSAIVLPDGNSYTFQYDSYLSLTELGLPSGGSIAYTWQNVVFNNCQSSNPMSRALLSRTVTPGDGQPSMTTTYSWPDNPGPGSGAAWMPSFPQYSIVTDANGNDTEYQIGGKDDAGNVWDGYVLTGITHYQGKGPHDTTSNQSTSTRLDSESYVLQTNVSYGAAVGTGGSWVQAPPWAVFIPPTRKIQVTKHLATPSGDILSAQKTAYAPNYGTCNFYTYPNTQFGSLGNGITDSGRNAPAPTSVALTNCYNSNQVASNAEYNYGSPGSGSIGALLKTNATTYLWQSSPNYLTANLLSLVNNNVITDGGGNWIAETDYKYDQSPSPTGVLGNQTATINYASSSTTYTSTIQYNSSGVPVLKTDPRLTETSYSNFACNGALPQTVTKAYGSTTTLPETSNYTYDCNTAKVLTVKDPNLRTTTFTYADPLSRVTSASYPDGGGVTVTYSDVASPNSFPITMTTQRTTGETAGPMITTTTYDGLSRKTKTQQVESSSRPYRHIVAVESRHRRVRQGL